MKIYYSGITDRGKYLENNEDNIYLDGIGSDNSEELFNSSKSCELTGIHTFAVCDGIGGSDCGEIASLTAINHLREIATRSQDYGIAECIFSLNAAVAHERHKLHLKCMGSTIALVKLQANALAYANVGDSRVYRYRGEKLEKLSKDHTRHQMMLEAGLTILRPEDSHRLTQNLGIDDDDDFVIEPFIGSCELQSGDVFILCSDGLTDALTDEAIEVILSSGEKSEDRAKALYEAAMAADSKDNISVITISIE